MDVSAPYHPHVHLYGSIPPLHIEDDFASGLQEYMQIGTLDFMQGKVSCKLAQYICGFMMHI
jgi:hypothetical protein